MARRELGPATLTVVQAVDAAVGFVDTSLIVACSGGADSLALAYAAQYVARRRAVPCSAVVVDHGLQAGSAAVAERVGAWLSSFGLAAEVATVVVDRGSRSGLEAAAREARYAALEAAARANRATVLLGHTLDDQAETVLLGLARGSGTRSLAGMAARVGPLLRPLLGLRRAETLRCCAELGLEPWSDPQNLDRRFARVRVRQTVLPVLEAELGPGVALALARTARLARDDADLLDQLSADADPRTDELDTAVLSGLPPAIRSRVIRRWLVRHGVRDTSGAQVGAVLALVTDWHGQGPIDLPGATVRRVRDRLYVVR